MLCSVYPDTWHSAERRQGRPPPWGMLVGSSDVYRECHSKGCNMMLKEFRGVAHEGKGKLTFVALLGL